MGSIKGKISNETSIGMMTNMKTKKYGVIREEDGSVHLLLCGLSTDHLLRVIKEYKPIHMDVFTSLELRQHIETFLKSIQDFSGTFHIEDIPAFTKDSLIVGSSKIMARYLILKKRFRWKSFYFGITGGTNTMAAEMTLAAIISCEKIHYVLHGNEQETEENQIIVFDTIELRNMIKNSGILDGEVHDKI